MLCVDHKLKGSVCWGCEYDKLNEQSEMYRGEYNKHHESCVSLFKHKTLVALAFDIERKMKTFEKNNSDLNRILKETEGKLADARAKLDSREQYHAQVLENVKKERDEYQEAWKKEKPKRKRKAKKKAKKEPPTLGDER